jgi:branched-chain amino acid aminotransferase
MVASGRVVFSNGTFVPEADAKISIFDSALMFGDMVFEMTRSFNGKQFKLEEHIERLFNGLKILRIPIQYTQKELKDIYDEHIIKNSEIVKFDI